jgi:predicted phage terminase large subunit-like protein
MKTPKTRAEIEAQIYMLRLAEDYDRAGRKLAHFIRSAWSVIEPGTRYRHGWHIDLISEYLEAVYLKQIKKLVINMRFRSIKSIAGTICYPAWVWTKEPSRRFITASYAGELATEHNVNRRDLIKSEWYQTAWGDKFVLELDDRKQFFRNSERGSMFAVGVGGSVVGKGGDTLIIDDPNDPKNASEVKIEGAKTWYDKTFSNRKNQEDSSEILIMQRVGDKDLTAHVLEKGGWDHLCIPWEAEKKTIIVFPVSKRELVRDKGDVMDPERFSKEMRVEWEKNLGPYGYAAQVQQAPRPQGGGFAKAHWWKRYGELPKDIFRVHQYWDCAEVPGVTNDYSVCATIGESPTGFYWLDVFRKQMGWPELEQTAKDLYEKWTYRTRQFGGVSKVKIEFKSAGIQLYQQFKAHTLLPIEKFEPGQRSKEVRAAAALPTIAAGNCYLPDSYLLSEGGDWVHDFIVEHEKFPHADHDDQVDTTSMAIEDLRLGEPEMKVWSA